MAITCRAAARACAACYAEGGVRRRRGLEFLVQALDPVVLLLRNLAARDFAF
jgi:hypothetical protein